jgi:phage gp29-like protein
MKLSEEIATTAKAMNYVQLSRIMPNPDFILRRAGKTTEAYKEIAADSKVKATTRTRRSSILALDYSIEGDNEEVTAFIMKHVKVSELIKTIFKSVLWGWQPIEIVWKYEESKWVPDKILAKPRDWFYFDYNEELYFREKGAIQGEKVNPLQIVCPRFEYEYGNPYGSALYADLFWAVIFKKSCVKFGLDWLERFGFPWIIGEHPAGANETIVQEILDKLLQLRQGGVTSIDSNSKVQVIENGGKENADAFHSFINGFNDEIAITVLGGNLITNTQGGSYAASAIQNEVREDIRDDDCEFISSEINRIIRLIVSLNFQIDEKDIPLFNFIWKKETTLELAERDIKLKSIGVKFTKKYIMENHELQEDDFELEEETATAQTTAVNDVKENEQFSESSEKAQEIIDKGIDSISKSNFLQVSDELIAPITKIIEESSDYSEAIEKIRALKNISTPALIELLYSTQGAAHIIGSESVKQEARTK